MAKSQKFKEGDTVCFVNENRDRKNYGDFNSSRTSRESGIVLKNGDTRVVAYCNDYLVKIVGITRWDFHVDEWENVNPAAKAIGKFFD